MIKKSFLKIIKPILQNKKGFLSFDLMIVIVALAIITTFSIIQVSVMSQVLINNKESELLHSMIVNARQLAINTNNNVTLNFEHQNLIISSDTVTNNKFDNLYFLANKSIYFNQKGHANQAYTMFFKEGSRQRKLIFYLGKGMFKIE